MSPCSRRPAPGGGNRAGGSLPRRSPRSLTSKIEYSTGPRDHIGRRRVPARRSCDPVTSSTARNLGATLPFRKNFPETEPFRICLVYSNWPRVEHGHWEHPRGLSRPNVGPPGEPFRSQRKIRNGFFSGAATMRQEAPFRCTRCNQESTFRMTVSGDPDRDVHAIYECPSCGHVDRLAVPSASARNEPGNETSR